MKRHSIILLVLILASAASARPTAESDTLLRVLREELEADFTELQKQEVKPYFMSFRVQETWKADIMASFGYLRISQQKHTRTFTPQIRVGSPELDNFKFQMQPWIDRPELPLTDATPDALRIRIWMNTLDAYQQATNDYREVQRRLRSQGDNEDKAPCFSMSGDSAAEEYYEPPLTAPALTPEEHQTWEQRLCRIAAVFRSHPEFNRAEALLQVENRRTHFVNTEGSAIIQNRRSYRIFLQAMAETEDGMPLPLSHNYFATSLDSLPDEATMIGDAEDIVRRLVALSQAPVAEPYTGPALLSGEASGVFFHEIFGHRLEGHRMKSGGQTFSKMVGEQVLPADFQVYCDPTLTHYGTQPLNGGYAYDDEGTRARRVNNVVDGVLREFLMSRVPLEGFPESNGHGRAAEGKKPVSRQSNLVVETRQPHAEAELRQMLRDEARRQGKEYGYLFQSVSGGYTMTGEGGSINSFDVTPLEVYRIYVDGRPDELVRGVSLIGTPLAMFSNIAAGGDTPSSFIGFCGAESGWVPVSATSPMIFCTKIETQRMQRKMKLRPVLAPPPLRAESWTTQDTAPDSIIFQALSDEMQRSMDSLRIEGQPAPFGIDYRMQRSQAINLSATLGEVFVREIQPWRNKVEAHIMLGDNHRTIHSKINWLETDIATAVDYDNLRRQAWMETDERYKSAIANYEKEKQQIVSTHAHADEEALDDRIPAKPVTSIQHRSAKAEDMHAHELEAYVRRLSLIAREYPDLTNSSSHAEIHQTDIYRLTSEGVRVAQPQDECTVGFNFQCNDYNGDRYNHKVETYANASEALADSTRFIREVHEAIDRRLNMLNDSLTEEEYYVGPVIIEENVGRTILNKVGDILRIGSRSGDNRKKVQKLNHKVVDEKLTIRQDPTLNRWEGRTLMGYYTADAYGQKPEAVTYIERGIFRNPVKGQYPTLVTNAPGNTRFDNLNDGFHTISIVSAYGVVRIESSKDIPLKKMRRQLLRIARREGYDHAYILRDGFTYRISTKDGSEKRMARTFTTITPDMLRHIEALSTEQEATSSSMNSIVGPKAMLLNDIEVMPSKPKQPAAQPLTNPLQRKQ